MNSNKPLPKRPGVLPFAIAITVLNLLGHTVLGFEQAWVVPFVAVLSAYAAEMAVEVSIYGWAQARFRGGFKKLVYFLLPAHISGLAVGMLLYTNERFVVVAFASALAIFSKVFFRAPVAADRPGLTIHFMNPSNFGITVTLLLFYTWVGVVPPYHFTENLGPIGDWVLPGIIVCSGSFLNYRATKRLPLIAAWLSAFVAQALVRSAIEGVNAWPMLAPMTGLAFVLFTFYMITDPMTTPAQPRAQVIFGVSVALLYGLLTHFGVVFGLFFALTAVCSIRGGLMFVTNRSSASAPRSAGMMASLRNGPRSA